MKRLPTLLLASAGVTILALAVETSGWRQNTYADFEKGSIKRLSLRSDGRLALAPASTEVLDSSSAYLWALAEDSKGNLYAGGGGPGGPGARVYLRTPDGNTKVLAELESLEVHALAIDAQDRLFAATAPDGKVYAVSLDGKARVFFDPGAKYIWALAFDSKGNLFVATGEEGLVYRVAPDGKGSVFFRTEESHARSLAIDAKDNLIVGTEPSGLILRISPGGDGFVLYQSPKSEITAVAVDKTGSIYAAGVGVKKPAPAPAVPAPVPVPSPPAPGTPVARPALSLPPSLSAPAPPVSGSEVYRIETDGYPRKVWSDAKEIAYAIGLDASGRALIGTGNRGVVYRIDSDVLYTALLTVPPTQVTGLFSGRGGRIYATTGNIGKVYRIGPGLEKEGALESDVFDAGLYSLWGRLSYRGRATGGGISLETRSGNLDRPGKRWSQWAPLAAEADGGRVRSPKARFLQWKLSLTAARDGSSPEVESVEVAFLPRNVEPVVAQIEITPPNYRFPAQSQSVAPSRTIALPPLGTNTKKTSRPAPATPAGSSSMQYAKGEIGARWTASDQNGDELVYTAEIRGAEETGWKPLKDKLKERQLSWDSTTYADGRYVVRVTASDGPDNPADQALTAQLTSEPFLIDNTPPEISGLAASRVGGKLDVRWKAKDALSVIARAEYSVNGGEWTFVLPVGQVSDSLQLEYAVSPGDAAAGENTVAVRVYDEYDNVSVASAVVK